MSFSLEKGLQKIFLSKKVGITCNYVRHDEGNEASKSFEHLLEFIFHAEKREKFARKISIHILKIISL